MRRIVVKYLQPKDVLLLHNLVIEATNGTHGVSDFTMFGSTVQSPSATFVGQEMYPTIIEKAAALLHSLLTKPVFIDQSGKNSETNSKTAILCCMTFLELNGYHFSASPQELKDFIMKAKKEKVTVDQTIDWIQTNCKRK